MSEFLYDEEVTQIEYAPSRALAMELAICTAHLPSSLVFGFGSLDIGRTDANVNVDVTFHAT